MSAYGGSSWQAVASGGLLFGTITVETSGTDHYAYITIKDDIPSNIDFVQDGYVGVGVCLNETELSHTQNQVIHFVEPTKTYNVKITDYVPVKPAMNKTGSLNMSTGICDWTVTVTNNANPIEYEGQQTFKDVLGGTNHDYVSGSLQVTATPGGAVTGTANYDSAARTLNFSYDAINTPGTVVTFSYKTKMNGSAFLSSGKLSNDFESISLKNTASLWDKDNTKIVEKAKTASGDIQKTWFSKNGTATGGADGETEWTIVVDSNGYSFENVVVYDQFSGNSTYPLQLKSGSVVVKKGAADVTDLSKVGGSGSSYDWKYSIGDVAAGDVYTITYKTTVKNYSDYILTNQAVPKNKAWFSFDWDWDGDGIFGTSETGLGIPGITKDTPVTSSVIDKSGVYHANNHTITWTIKVNENKLPLAGVVVKDEIPDTQEYVSHSSAIAGMTYDSTNHEFTIGNALNGSTGTITLVTKLKDTEAATFAGNNTSNTYSNKAKLYKDTNVLVDSDTAAVTATSQVIDKKDGVYDFNTHQTSWEVELNQNQMSMTGVRVEDTLPEGMSLVGSSVTFGGAPVPERVSGIEHESYTYNSSTRLFTFYSDSLTATKTLAYKTEITDVNAFPGMLVNQSETVTNTARLYNQYSSVVAVDSGDVTISNKILDKTGSVDPNTNILSYTVNINQAQAVLPAGTVISDTLTEGIMLDSTSIVLKKANVSSTGAFSLAGGTETVGVTISSTGNGTVMRLTLPNIPNNKQAYILTYRARITDNTRDYYDNCISIDAGGGSTSSDKRITKSEINTAGGYLGSLSRVVAVKENSAHERLSGAVFALSLNGNVIATKTTDNTGTVTFVGLTTGSQYVVEEITPPAGYSLSGTSSQTITAPAGGDANKLTVTFENQPLPTNPGGGNSGGHSGGHSGGSGGGTTTPANEVTPANPTVPINPGNSQAPSDEITQKVVEVVTHPQDPDFKDKTTQLRKEIKQKMKEDSTWFTSLPKDMQQIVKEILDEETPLGVPNTGDNSHTGVLYLVGLSLILLGARLHFKRKRECN